MKLQRPDYAYMNGKIIPWDEATIHIGCEAATRGLNVFEGLKGYWYKDGRFGIVFLERHFKRLQRSAKLMYIPCPWTYKEFENAVFELVGTLLNKEKDMWMRPTLFVVEGHWGEGTKADLVITAYNQDKEEPSPIKVGVSSWQRAIDPVLPARIKTSTNYQIGRFARIDGRTRGFQDMILLNQWGRVAEATASCVIMVRDGVIYTPPATEGALESITIDFVEEIAKSLNIEFIRRPIDRTELLISDEVCICGTLAELVPVEQIDTVKLNPETPILSKIRKKFYNIVRGMEEHPEFEVSFVPESKNKKI